MNLYRFQNEAIKFVYIRFHFPVVILQKKCRFSSKKRQLWTSYGSEFMYIISQDYEEDNKKKIIDVGTVVFFYTPQKLIHPTRRSF